MNDRRWENTDMKKLILFLLLIVTIPNMVFASSDTTFIDVKIGKTYEEFERLNIYSDTNLALFQRNDLDNELLVFDGNKIYVGKTFGVNDKIDIYNSENKYITSIPSNGSVLIGPRQDYESHLKVGEKEYRGLITFIEDNTGLKVINHIDIEQYLRGVVPREIPSLSPNEALKAQAVAARSYAYSTLTKHSKEGYNLCDTTHCQVYGGFSDENIHTDDAIIDTSDIVVKFNGSIANTVFHSSSGGFTESSENIWGNKLNYLKGKEDPYSLNTINSFWTVEIDKELFSDILNDSGYEIDEINDISIVDIYMSGRVKEICINENNERLILTGEKFRSLIGTTKIKSTLFKIDGLDPIDYKEIYVKGSQAVTKLTEIQILSAQDVLTRSNTIYSIIDGDSEIRTVENNSVNHDSTNNIVVSGQGYGHGVGMSQYGAIEMAKQGFDYIDILKYYYSDVEITKIN
ncbi:MAG: SpoIID/LytB domain-containing protein [Gudongella sp.]|nr:SpoIID/LytB domain-containing protein [Gudongella sp.]